MATAGSLIREARLRAGLTQADLGQRTNADRAQIARWERDDVAIGFDTLRTHLHACGFDFDLTLLPYDKALHDQLDQELQETLELTPKERIARNQNLLTTTRKKKR